MFYTIAVNFGYANRPSNQIYYYIITFTIAILTTWYALKIRFNPLVGIVLGISTLFLPFMIWGSFIILLWKTPSAPAPMPEQ